MKDKAERSAVKWGKIRQAICGYMDFALFHILQKYLFCASCTIDLNGIPSEEDVFFPMALSRKQTFRRKVDEKMFLQSWSIDSIVCLVRSINTTKFSVIFL